ncbi:glycine--tRNA ligase [Candidatus Nomurabacteria bacterium RIFCSPHIGHO2_02_FULL_38_15]|uniref:Glycine--tRNA ligase n=1 Tax=Candidatus Nomurabacteria bacterium RIFCSPHIGHO2_02_FULL_38_15 TaxID=1801752 RepID=A0A1F6VQI9_9BACT|nr:MAG: glycine--tRNA ligase [Candidatus Nomurabacteria bacterium RIFCSPHIGHO2_02_FULL_38_15]
MDEKSDLMEKIISLCKRRGFIYPGSEIYGGLAGTYDYGPLGVALKNNIKNSWWKKFVDNREDMYGIDAAILMNAKVWQTTGHVDNFSDPMVDCKECKKRFRPDQLDNKKSCPECGGAFGIQRNFNMMFATQIGAVEDSSATVYLRPETAQGMFVNFKNVVDSLHPKLPFGLAQIGKAFRNEITPRDFIFRMREFEQMEIEYFVNQNDWQKYFDYWKDEILEWMDSLGIDMNSVHELEVEEADRAHYSSRTVDFEFDFPFGRKELYGLAYRTDFDLQSHTGASLNDLSYLDETTGERFVPHVIEPSFGLERSVLALLASAYKEDGVDGEIRQYLAFKPAIAPVICAVSPLLKNKPELQSRAREVYGMLKQEFGRVMYDDNGNIGKRYRRQDEIGTPFCIVVDFDSLENQTVTVRDRDTQKQELIKIDELVNYLKSKLV